MRRLRVGFCGASGTGKTTLMRAVADEFGLEVCPVGARSVTKAMGFENPYDVDAAGRRVEFQKRLIEEKIEWESARDSFVTDRTHFDNLAYATMHQPRLAQWELDRFFDQMRARYTHVVYCPLSEFQHLGDDPVRVKEPGYHWLFDRVLRAFLDDLGNTSPSVLRLYCLETADRRRHVLGFIRG